MSGIAGVCHREDSYELVKDILEKIKHRGPDNTSIIPLNGIALGQNCFPGEKVGRGQNIVAVIGGFQRIDRMTMAHSLDVDIPIMNNEVAEFAYSLPIEWKIYEEDGKKIEKWILRKAFEGEKNPSLSFKLGFYIS